MYVVIFLLLCDFCNVNMKTLVVLKKIAIPLVLLSVSLLGAWFYRPWIYCDQINDWHIADSFPSFFSIQVPYYFYDSFCSLTGKQFKSNQAILGIVIGNIFYELIQIPIGGFDWFDILAIFIGAAVVFILDRLGFRVTHQ